MKKPFLLMLLAVVLGAVQASALTPQWGVRVNCDLTLPGTYQYKNNTVDMFRAGSGVSAGVVCHLSLAQNWFVEPGALLFYDTYSYKDLIVASDLEGNPLAIDPTIKKTGFRIPVMLGFQYDFSDRLGLEIYTGPQLNYAFHGSCSYEDDEDMLRLFGPHGTQRRLDASWNIGVALLTGPYRIGAGAEFGMSNLNRVTPPSYHENRFHVSLGYNF